MNLVLASNSPRRKDILIREGYDFTIVKSDYNEVNIISSPKDTAVNNAVGKASDVYKKLNDSNAVILGADTIVVFDGKIIGKPKDENDAIKTLKLLSGNTHKVITGYAVICNGKVEKGYSETKVTFENLSEELIYEYVKTGKPMDKAGSYGLQDGYIKIKGYSGDYDNIIGLPIKEIKKILDKYML